MIAAIIFSGMGLVFLILGFTVWKLKIVNIIAGYDEKKIKDKEGLAKYFGILLLSISAISFIFAVLNFLFESDKMENLSFMSFSTLTTLMGAIAIVGVQKYGF